jgi:hypothetical protein
MHFATGAYIGLYVSDFEILQKICGLYRADIFIDGEAGTDLNTLA